MNSFPIIFAVTLAIVAILTYLINKVIPLKLYPLVKVILWGVIAFLGYQLYNSVFEPVRFNKEKVKRYKSVIANLKDIQKAEVMHGKLKGVYTSKWSELIHFIENDSIPIIQQRDSIYKVTIAGIDQEKEMKVIDTLRKIPVIDSLFKGKIHYRRMKYIPIKNKYLYYKVEGKDTLTTLLADSPATYKGEYTPMTFKLETTKFPYKGDTLSLFRVQLDKKYILTGQNKDLINQERQALENDQIKGEYVRIGSLQEVKENGNWPPLYDKE